MSFLPPYAAAVSTVCPHAWHRRARSFSRDRHSGQYSARSLNAATISHPSGPSSAPRMAPSDPRRFGSPIRYPSQIANIHPASQAMFTSRASTALERPYHSRRRA